MRSAAGRSWLRPDVERIISALQGLPEKVVFVGLSTYYYIKENYMQEGRQWLDSQKRKLQLVGSKWFRENSQSLLKIIEAPKPLISLSEHKDSSHVGESFSLFQLSP